MVKKIKISNKNNYLEEPNLKISINDIQQKNNDEWQNRLSPHEEYSKYHYLNSLSKEQEEQEEQEEEKEEKKEVKESINYDEDFFLKNKETIDDIGKNEARLKQNPDLFKNDPLLILYRLPITEAQREKIYNDLIKNNNK